MCQPSSVPEMVKDALDALGVLTASPLLRTILIQDRHLVGQKFRFEGGYALWLSDKNVVEVYDDDGELVETVTQRGVA